MRKDLAHLKISKIGLGTLLVFGMTAALTFGCAHQKKGGEEGSFAKVTSVADGGAYAEVTRGNFEIGASVILFKRECKEIPVRGKPGETCSNLEYGVGRVERRLEDGHLFLRSDAISVPVGTQIRVSEDN